MISVIVQRLSIKKRWQVHLLILQLPILVIFIQIMLQEPNFRATGFVSECIGNIDRLLHAVTCLGLAFMISKVSASQLWIRPQSISKILVFSFIWSIGLRLCLIPIVLMAANCNFLPKGSGSGVTEYLAENQQLLHNPLLAILGYGFSAIVIGFTEELWHAGTLAALYQLYPNMFEGFSKILIMLTIVSCIFALGHLNQSALNVAGVVLFGVGTGIILILRKSFWEAAVTHALFNAATYIMAYLSLRHS